jgi:hypothetical protein
MAHVKFKTPTPAASVPVTSPAALADGPTFYTPAAEDITSSPLQPLDAAGLGEIGAEGDSETIAQPAPFVAAVSPPVAAAPTPATPAPQPTVANDPRVDTLLQRISGVAEAAKTDITFLRAELVKTLHDNVHPRIEEIEAQLKRIAAAAVASKNDGAAAALKRLDALDAMLSQSGLQTSETAALPQLHLRRYPATRHIIRKPEVAADGNSVIMFYNPKPQAPGENGDMIELNITQAGRKIATGYTVDVPEGYVCDVVVGTDVVASVQGRGEAELSVLLTSRGPARHVGAGYEIAKLTLRRMERLTAKVD